MRPSVFVSELEAALRRAGREFKAPHQIGGRLDARNLKRSATNIAVEMQSFSDLMAPDSMQLLLVFVEQTRALLDAGMRTQSIQGVDAVFAHELIRDLTRKLIYQELVSRRRGMGDRGIRRIAANIELAEALHAQLGNFGLGTPRDRLMMRLIHVHQDLGHTAYAARVSYRGGRLHRAYGARIFTDEMNRFRPLLNPKELDLVRTSVATHSSEELPIAQEIVLSLVRAVDHLAPFAPYRVYKHLESVEGASDYLDDMLKRAQAGDGAKYGALRASLRRFLAETTELSEPLRDDIIADFRAIDRGADFIDIGQLGGQISGLGVEPMPPGRVAAHVTRDAFTLKYQSLFDHQQDQLARMARTTRVVLADVGNAVRFQVAGLGALDISFE